MNVRQLGGLLTIPFLLACSGDDNGPSSSRAIHGSGILETQIREVATFSAIRLATVGEVIVAPGPTQSLSVTVDDNVMAVLTTVVSGGELQIGIEGDVEVTDIDLTVSATLANLDGLAIDGVGSIIGTESFLSDDVSLSLSGVGSISVDLEVERLMTSLSGVGNLSISGSSPWHRCTVSGVGNVAAFGLTTDTTNYMLSGEGDAELNASTRLEVMISGQGRVYYRGHPSINLSVSGTGEIIDAN